MTGWIIAAAVAALLAWLLFIPIRFRVSYCEKKVQVRANYLFVTIPLYPRPKKKKKKPAKATQKVEEQAGVKKPSYLMKLMKEDGLGGILDFISHLSGSGKRLLEKVLKHTKVKDFRLLLLIVGDDAAETALKYGRTCAVFYPVFSYLCGLARITVQELSVLPDFKGEKSREEFSFVASISPIFLLVPGLGFFLRLFVHTIAGQFRKQKAPVHNQTKAVH